MLLIERLLGSDDVGCVCSTSNDVGHDGDQGMLFNVEWAGVEGPGVAKCREMCSGEGLFEELAGGEGDQLGDEGSDLDRWI